MTAEAPELLEPGGQLGTEAAPRGVDDDHASRVSARRQPTSSAATSVASADPEVECDRRWVERRADRRQTAPRWRPPQRRPRRRPPVEARRPRARRRGARIRPRRSRGRAPRIGRSRRDPLLRLAIEPGRHGRVGLEEAVGAEAERDAVDSHRQDGSLGEDDLRSRPRGPPCGRAGGSPRRRPPRARVPAMTARRDRSRARCFCERRTKRSMTSPAGERVTIRCLSSPRRDGTS